MKHTEFTLLIDRLLMAQGAIALLEKNLSQALTILQTNDRLRKEADDQEQEQFPGPKSHDEVPWQ